MIITASVTDSEIQQCRNAHETDNLLRSKGLLFTGQYLKGRVKLSYSPEQSITHYTQEIITKEEELDYE